MYSQLLFVLMALFFLSGCATKPEIPNTNTTLGSYQSQMKAYVNNIRANGTICGSPTQGLQENSALKSAALAHARDMAYNNFLSHTGSGTVSDPAKSAVGAGSDHVQRILYFGYPHKVGYLLGEAIANVPFRKTKTQDYMINFKYAISKIIHDRAHCELLMNPHFNYVGMAMVKGSDSYYFVMDLAQ